MEDVAGQRSPAKITLEHLKEEQREQLLQIVDKQPNLFRTEPERTKLIEHIIQLTDPTPIRQQPYRVPERLIEPLRREIQLIKDMGVIEPSTSPWSSRPFLVPKKDGSLRICLDFRKLNVVSRFDAYPMPQIDELVEQIGQAKYITTLDLCKGYWQVPLAQQFREYTAFRTPLGLFHFTTMPFGLLEAPATFQRLMNQVLRGAEDYYAAYLDGVVIYSGS